MVNIIHRYFAGDKSLLGEIEANAASDHPMAQMAKASLPKDNLELQEDKKRKRIREDAELQRVRIANINSFNSLMSFYNPNWVQEDKRLVLQMQDHLKNVFMQPTTQNSITNGESAELASITVSQVALDMDRHFTNPQLFKIGKKIAQKYR